MTPVPVIIDADPGTDDIIAILVALGSPGLELRGVTTVGGNASVEVTTDNALRVISLVQPGVPVFAGAAAPLRTAGRYGSGPLARPHRPSQEEQGYGLPPAEVRAQDQPAVDFLIDSFTGAQAADTVLVATGPLTNIASAIGRQPRLRQAIRRLVLMGGSRGPGNATPSADFNFWADPQAARVVLRAGLPDVVMFPLDVTRSAVLTDSDCAHIQRAGAAGELAARLIRSRMTASGPGQPAGAARVAAVHDAYCPSFLVAPVVSRSQRCLVDVDTGQDAARGTSTIAPAAAAGGQAGVEVVLSARADILARTIADATGRLSAHGRLTRPGG